MSGFVPDVERDLDYFICRKGKISPALAVKWKWRILNEYPEDLQQLVFAWAEDRSLPNIEYNDVSLERILNGTFFEFLDAVDLLYILHKDPKSGYEIFLDSIIRDAAGMR